jgi:penicillin amidase
LLAKALERILDDLTERFGADFAGWRWGAVHQARFRHRLLDGLPLVGSLAELKIATDGGGYTVNRGGSRVSDRDRPYEHIHGAGLRAVYDLDNLENSRFVIATGQSGNPLSPHYGDQLGDWRDGRSFRLGRALPAEAVVLLRLLPEQP